MPWCAACSRYLTPTSLDAGGTCPSCGREVEGTVTTTTGLPPAPWHFKLMLGAFALYLGWRFFEMGAWLLRRL
jgi:hypothetical protein